MRTTPRLAAELLPFTIRAVMVPPKASTAKQADKAPNREEPPSAPLLTQLRADQEDSESAESSSANGRKDRTRRARRRRTEETLDLLTNTLRDLSVLV